MTSLHRCRPICTVLFYFPFSCLSLLDIELFALQNFMTLKVLLNGLIVLISTFCEVLYCGNRELKRNVVLSDELIEV